MRSAPKETVLGQSFGAKLRGAGLSENKFIAVRDLAEKCLSGVVKPRKELEKLSDAEIIARLKAEYEAARAALAAGEPVPTLLPTGSSPSVRPSRATTTSRGSSRGGTAARVMPSAG